jgi:hypothetical protein
MDPRIKLILINFRTFVENKVGRKEHKISIHFLDKHNLALLLPRPIFLV